jgi:hypothetical protein
MATRTLYVSDEDDRVWQQAKGRGASTDESLSRLATEALRVYLEAEDDNAADDVADEVVVSITKADHTTLINRFRQLLQRFGRDRVAVAYARACYWEGAARSRAKRKADDTMGVVDRSQAAAKATQAKGVEGRQRTARKAGRTRKG